MLKTNIEHQKFLYKLLTNKNSYIRKTLLNKHIPFLNERLYYYLTELELPHIVKFGHDLSAQIHKFGKKLEFGNLSNGQKSRVNIALSLAFRDILEKIYGKINILIMDEVLDRGLDGPGAELAAKILKHKTNQDNISLFVITHRNEMDSVFDNIITIEMENNFSKVLND
jgi:DNA repair exonuclease SbcCD ATPase subunit